MSSLVTLKAAPRTDTGKGVARKLRAQGKLPAVVYGANEEALPLVLDNHETELLFRAISLENTIIQLEVEGESKPMPSLVREVQTHAFRPDILHVDFYRVQTGVELELDVPLRLEGTPTGVKDQGGVLEQVIYELSVRCVPSAIPEYFVADVSGLSIGDSFHVSDLDVPEGVVILRDLERTLCTVQAPTELASDTEDEEEDELEPEVIGAEEPDEDEEGEEPSEG
jgi:large subunit ribosomal protein L25